jgi:hypothetical protein
MNDRPEKSDFCYVDIAARGTFEGTVLSAGKDYMIRLEKDDEEVVTVPNSAVWTAPPTPEV